MPKNFAAFINFEALHNVASIGALIYEHII